MTSTGASTTPAGILQLREPDRRRYAYTASAVSLMCSISYPAWSTGHSSLNGSQVARSSTGNLLEERYVPLMLRKIDIMSTRFVLCRTAEGSLIDHTQAQRECV